MYKAGICTSFANGHCLLIGRIKTASLVKPPPQNAGVCVLSMDRLTLKRATLESKEKLNGLEWWHHAQGHINKKDNVKSMIKKMFEGMNVKASPGDRHWKPCLQAKQK